MARPPTCWARASSPDPSTTSREGCAPQSGGARRTGRFVLRNRGPFTSDIAAYTAVLRSVTAKRGAALYRARQRLPGQGARQTRPSRLRLRAQPERRDLHEITALKAEALAMLGRYRQALGAFDTALAARPNGCRDLQWPRHRALALGRLDAADADWRRQLELLPPEQASARACVSLRMADYEAALPELQRALEKEPADPYWQLYRLTALHRLGRTAGQPGFDGAAADAWPGPLLALHAGQLSGDDALKRADNEGRRAEACSSWASSPARTTARKPAAAGSKSSRGPAGLDRARRGAP